MNVIAFANAIIIGVVTFLVAHFIKSYFQTSWSTLFVLCLLATSLIAALFIYFNPKYFYRRLLVTTLAVSVASSSLKLEIYLLELVTSGEKGVYVNANVHSDNGLITQFLILFVFCIIADLFIQWLYENKQEKTQGEMSFQFHSNSCIAKYNKKEDAVFFVIDFDIFNNTEEKFTLDFTTYVQFFLWKSKIDDVAFSKYCYDSEGDENIGDEIKAPVEVPPYNERITIRATWAEQNLRAKLLSKIPYARDKPMILVRKAKREDGEFSKFFESITLRIQKM